MAYSVLNAKQDLIGILHGTTLNKVQNINGVINRTARQLIADIDPQEMKRVVLSSTPIFNKVYDYACPVDLKGNRIIDIAPQFLRQPGNFIGQTYNQAFDISKNALPSVSEFTIIFNNAVKTIRINDATINPGILLDAAQTTNEWAVSGTASDLSIDNVNYVSGSGSLQFNLAAGANPSTGGLVANIQGINLSTHLNQSTLFYYVYFPTGSDIISTTLQWGSSASDYYQVTSTTTFETTTLATGWNLIAAPWLGASVVGNPDASSISYISVGVNYNGTAQTAVHIDNIISNLGLYRNIEYYSKYLFRSALTGAFQETVTDDSNLINLETESYNLFLNLFAFFCIQQVQGLDGLFFDSNFFGQEYMKGKDRYTSLYKSEITKPRTPYYTEIKGGYDKYLGIRYG